MPVFDALKQQVTDLGLQFSLVTKWTSFVAVSEQIVNANPESTADARVPLPPVAGVFPRADGSSAPAFVGAAGPEASTWAGLLVVLAMLGGLWRRHASAGTRAASGRRCRRRGAQNR